MTRTDYLGALGTLLLAVVMALLLLRPAAGERWFDAYGLAAVALPAAIAGGLILARRYRTLGRPPWHAAAIGGAVALLAALHIGYWLAVFHLGQAAVGLVLVRAVVRDLLGPWLPALIGLAAAGLAWLLLAAARPLHADD